MRTAPMVGDKSTNPIKFGFRGGEPKGTARRYRDIEYTVVQGIGRQLWKWAVSFESIHLRGQGATKSEAIAGAERGIDRALAPKKLMLVRREIDYPPPQFSAAELPRISISS